MGRSAQLRRPSDLSVFQEGGAMHDNPRATEEEQRSGYAPPEAADEDEE